MLASLTRRSNEYGLLIQGLLKETAGSAIAVEHHSYGNRNPENIYMDVGMGYLQRV